MSIYGLPWAWGLWTLCALSFADKAVSSVREDWRNGVSQVDNVITAAFFAVILGAAALLIAVFT